MIVTVVYNSKVCSNIFNDVTYFDNLSDAYEITQGSCITYIQKQNVLTVTLDKENEENNET